MIMSKADAMNLQDVYAAFEGHGAESQEAYILLAERRLRILKELGDIGMTQVRALGRQAVKGGRGPDEPDPVEAYVRLSRAIRVTIVLQARIDAALRAARATA
jgi:hypothetical protein